MSRDRLVRTLLIANLVGLFAVGSWLRATSLNLPAVGGDEAFFGVQAARIVQGRSIEWWTPSRRPVNLFVVGAELPLHAWLGPSWVTIKAPAVLCGMLTVAATWLVLRKTDRATALVAATLAAVAPILIVESRIGVEAPWIPLVGTLALGAALAGHRARTILAFLLCYYVHPTFLFLLPVLGLTLAGRIWSDAADRRTAVRRIVGAALAMVVVVAPLALAARGPTMRWTFQTYHFGPMDWGRFLIGFERMLLGYCESGRWDTSRGLDLAFWVVVVGSSIAGTVGLLRARSWDRLGLLAGLLISMTALHALTGPEIMQPGLTRYALFLVPPTLIGAAFLIEAIPRVGGPLPVGRLWGLTRALAVAGAWLLLLASKHGTFDPLVAHADGLEDLRTLATETPDPRAWVASILRADREPGEPLAVVAEDWWTYRPLQFWLSDRPETRVASLEPIDVADRDALVLRVLEQGGYLVATVGQPESERVRSLVRPHRLRHWHVAVSPNPCLVVYRLKRLDEPATVDPIVLLQPGGGVRR